MFSKMADFNVEKDIIYINIKLAALFSKNINIYQLDVLDLVTL